MSDYKAKLSTIEKRERIIWWRGILFGVSFVFFCLVIVSSYFTGASPKSYVSAFNWFISTGNVGGFQIATIVIGTISGFAGLVMHMALVKMKNSK